MSRTHINDLLAVLAVTERRIKPLRDPSMLRLVSNRLVADQLDEIAGRLEQAAQEIRGANEEGGRS